ncbi:helix-turn-helix transcriptional regulator [Rhizohabitans arisaemae]|uniref:helix-turn-helix transcriptional regulator n=1 Tax=Rhizohabitans arisaemae TaxID=2720610 RepID=UPI0024B1E27C|nr:WYL domain-containing protein [Rhizohabitans arisaemae]
MGNVNDAPGLTAAEIAALALSLAHLGTGPQAGAARTGLRAALAHLDAGDDVIASTLRTLTTPLTAETARRARIIATSITDRRVLRLCYRDAHGRLSVRDVDPVTCLVHREHWYLVTWCRLRHGIRAFRFDRLLAVEPTDLQSHRHSAQRFLPFQRRSAA